MNNRILKSLRLQLFCAVLISFAVGLGAFGIAFFLGDAMLDQTVYGQTFAETMADQHFSQLQEYVEEEEISLTNLQRLNPWCSRGDKVYLPILMPVSTPSTSLSTYTWHWKPSSPGK